MEYTQLGSALPSGSRQASFLEARNAFEAHRNNWIAEGKPRFVQMTGARPVVFADDEEDLPRETGDDQWSFEIRSEAEERAFWQSIKASTFELLAEPYLDTDMPQWVFQADRVLEVRGYSARRQRILRSIALTGLFWNMVLWWDWMSLSLGDFFYGWAMNFVFLSIPVGLAVFFGLGLSGYAAALWAGPVAFLGTLALAALSCMISFHLYARDRRRLGLE